MNFTFLTALASPAFAQEFSLSLSPPLLEVMLQPGKTVTQAYQVKNEGNSLLYLQSEVILFTPDSVSGQIIYPLSPFLEPKPEFSLNNADLDLGEIFVLQPGESRQLVLKVKASPGLEEKDYYATFFIKQSPGENLGEASSSRFSGRIGSHLLLAVSQSGKLDFQAQISQFQALPKVADYWQKVEFPLMLSNRGKTFFKAAGKIEIYDWLGRKRAELVLRPDNILAFSQRKLICQNQECLFSSFLPGRFEAKLTIAPNGVENSALFQSVFFWILPYKLILTLIILGLIIFSILKPKLPLDKKKKMSQNGFSNNNKEPAGAGYQ